MTQNYIKPGYITKDRWNNYWYQIDSLKRFRNAKTVLEIGPGNKVVNDMLKKLGFLAKSVDVDKSVSPDYIASAEKIPVDDKSYDLVLAAEIIEHLPFEKVDEVLEEIKRIAKTGAVISLPHSGYTLSLGFKVPLIKWKFGILKIPHFWRRKTSTEEHFWELGLRNYPVRKFKKILKKAGFKIINNFIGHDDPSHIFFVLEL
ncbi:methyltransferase domain-containing protein [Candidatus Parcubacteria bacterium]|nr:MAG: methyltransferase domain-containing protein [Candidatus Parcubacteria bacterium]